MPSLRHEALRLLVEKHPALVVELLREGAKVPIPAYATIELESIDLTHVTPAEYRSDAVVVLRQAEPVLAVVVEVQLRPDEEKRWSWPVYATTVRATYRCPAVILVLTVEDKVAVWAATAIELGPPGNAFLPVVVGPERIPQRVDPQQVKANPELAVLSALAHGKKESWPLGVAQGVIEVLGTLDHERAAFYSDLIMVSVADSVRNELEAMMIQGYEYQSTFAKTYFAQGVERGRQEGRHEGRQEGQSTEAQRALRAVIEARGWVLSPELSQTLLACNDVTQLETWLRQAVTAASLDELLVR